MHRPYSIASHHRSSETVVDNAGRGSRGKPSPSCEEEREVSIVKGGRWVMLDGLHCGEKG